MLQRRAAVGYGPARKLSFCPHVISELAADTPSCSEGALLPPSLFWLPIDLRFRRAALSGSAAAACRCAAHSSSLQSKLVSATQKACSPVMTVGL